MHERALKQNSIDEQVLNNFTSKVNQSFNDFVSQFEYKDDPNIVIKEPNSKKFEKFIESISENNHQPSAIKQAEIVDTKENDELEIFDNFVTEKEEASNDNIDLSSDDFLNQINNKSYVPSVKLAEDEKKEKDEKGEEKEIVVEKVEKEVLSDSQSTELQSVKFPGEILDEPSTNDSSKLHCTQLNISTKTKETNTNEISSSNDDNNLVEPFELDPDYDYSQHIFTPRYTH